MGGSTTYNAPGPSEEETAYYSILKDQTSYEVEQKKKKDESDAQKAKDLKAYGESNWSDYFKNLTKGYEQGLYTNKDFEDAAKAFEKEYGLTTGYTGTDVSKLSSQYLKDIDTKRETKIKSAFEDLLGRKATAEDISKYQDLYDAGLNDTQLLDKLKSSTEYTDKFAQSYYEAYNDELYGKKVYETDKEGKKVKTDKRTYTFDTSFEPTYTSSLGTETGLSFGEGATTITGNISQIEEAIQAQRQKRQFMYDSGLTKLQGQIDKDIQKIKNEGGEEVAKIQAQSNLYGQLLGGFTF